MSAPSQISDLLRSEKDLKAISDLWQITSLWCSALSPLTGDRWVLPEVPSSPVSLWCCNQRFIFKISLQKIKTAYTFSSVSHICFIQGAKVYNIRIKLRTTIFRHCKIMHQKPWPDPSQIHFTKLEKYVNHLEIFPTMWKNSSLLFKNLIARQIK